MDNGNEFDGKWYLKVLVSSSLGLQILLYVVLPWRKRSTSRVVLGLISIIFSLSNWIPAVTLMLITSCVVFSNDGGTTGPESPLLAWASLMLLHLAGHGQERRTPLFLQPSENAINEYLKVIFESLFYLVIFLIAFSLHSKSWNNETSPSTLFFMLLACLKTIVKLKRLRKSSGPYEYIIRNNYNIITISTTPSDACREIEAEIERMYYTYYGGLVPDALIIPLVRRLVLVPNAVIISSVLIPTLAYISFPEFSKYTICNILLPIFYITLFVVEYFMSEYLVHRIYHRGRYQLPRWSRTIQRFNLLTYSLRKPSKISASIHHMLNTWPSSGKEQYTDNVGSFVFKILRDIVLFSDLTDIVFRSSSYDPRSKLNLREHITAAKGLCVIKHENHQDLVDCEAPFVERVLLWHVATGILYHTDTITPEDNQSCFMSMVLSDYMGYLLLVQPWIMSKQRGAVLQRCLQMWAEIYELIKDSDIQQEERICEMFINQQQSSGMDQTKTLLQDAYVLAKKLGSTFLRPDHRWRFIARVWVEKLAYAASQCSPIHHIQGLSQGGELATIVWLWILHFETTSESDVHSIYETRELLKNIKHFSYSKLRVATNDFNSRNILGGGGFGRVYKGTFESGLQVAVKKLFDRSQLELREFLTEINTISNVRHPNLVELIGCCVEGGNRILVYEFVENKSLDRALFGINRTLDIALRGFKSKLNWEKRSAICLGTAKALAFLHEELVPHIVHRDIKSRNVLLDKDYLPKIGDFGLAKLFPDDFKLAKLFPDDFELAKLFPDDIGTRTAGNTCYLAPEYAMGGHLTTKADVYSFGVLTLEIISGKSSEIKYLGRSKKRLLEWAWQLYEEGRLLELVDMGKYPEDMVMRYMIVAFFCTQADANRRPLMSQVIEMLSPKARLNEKELELLEAPGFFPDTEKV